MDEGLEMITQVLYAVSLVVAVLVPWNVQEWRLGAHIAALKTQQATALVAALAGQQRIENAITLKYQEALNASIARENILRNHRAVAVRESDSLRKRANEATSRLVSSNIAPATVIEYASAANELLVDCSRKYQELAEKSDGHAADVRMILEAWPVGQGTDMVAK